MRVYTGFVPTRMARPAVERPYLAFARGSNPGGFCSSANSKPLRYASFTIFAIFSKLIFSTGEPPDRRDIVQ
jgi:hypothetical protein